MKTLVRLIVAVVLMLIFVGTSGCANNPLHTIGVSVTAFGATAQIGIGFGKEATASNPRTQ